MHDFSIYPRILYLIYKELTHVKRNLIERLHNADINTGSEGKIEYPASFVDKAVLCITVPL